MKRTREITITHYRRRIVRKSQAAAAECCPVCGDGAEMVTVAEAILLTGIIRSTLGGWISKGQVHSTRSRDGQLRICLRSLFSQAGRLTYEREVNP